MTIIRKTAIIGVLLFTFGCGGANQQPTDVQDEAVQSGGSTAERVLSEEEMFRRDFHNPGGMWMPSQMLLESHRDNFEKMGVELSAAQMSDPLGHPMSAIVSLGGCSASFVSKEGLVVTNHHCVQGALRHNSNEKQNLVEDGFLAKTREDEVPAGPTRKILVAKAMRDVTLTMRDGLERIKDPIKRKRESEDRYKRLIAKCEGDKPGVKCSIAPFYGDGLYMLIEYLEIRDVRLVYVPKRSVGNYGGEIDNWQWPRHTGDFSFYRAYVGPDGGPAEYSDKNVPFKPDTYLTVSTEGVQADDFVMVVGYPGRTARTNTAAQVKHDVDWYYPTLIKYLKERYDLTEKLTKSEDKAAAMKAGVAKQFVQNGLENYQGKLKGLTGGDLLKRKQDLDAKIKEWAAQPGNEKYKADIEKMESLHQQAFKTSQADLVRRFAFNGSGLLGVSLKLVRMAEERPKKDKDRKPGYQDRDMKNLVAYQKSFARSFDKTLDRAVFKHTLMWALELPKEERPWLPLLLGAKKKQNIDEAAIDAALDKMYGTTKLEDEKLRVDLMQEGTKAKLKQTKDPFIKAALAIWSTYKKEEERVDKRYGDYLLVDPAYAHAMKEVLNGVLAPDANSTLRISYGTVKSFKEDASAEPDWPFTLGKQIPKKNTGKRPFDAPDTIIEAIKAKKYGPYARPELGGELPVDFLSDLDITGGNSGSATLNHKGELVGLAFDGTIEGVASDLVFNGETSRTISVDVRYMLWVMDAIDNADHLLKEMGVEPAL